MVVEVTSDFNKDIRKLRDKKLLLAIKTALQQWSLPIVSQIYQS